MVVVVDWEHVASLLAASTGRPDDAATLPKSGAEEKPAEVASTGVDSGRGCTVTEMTGTEPVAPVGEPAPMPSVPFAGNGTIPVG